jgi:ppGpp synthetase/RelA/SpoT-type nucleotidyltranferase
VAAASYEEVAEAFASERPAYAELAEILGTTLQRRLDAQGLETIVSWRAKHVDSFVKKALRKGYEDPIEQIGDKAGVRVIVHYLADVPIVEDLVRDLCHVDRREAKLDALAYDELGYLGVHLDVRPKSETVQTAAIEGLQQRRVEIQIHTKAQSAWAVVSHELLYKSAVQAPAELRRDITRLVALVELFDAEVARFREALESHPDFTEMTVMQPLDDAIVRFTGRRPDPGLSVLSIPTVVRLYTEPPADVFAAVIEPFLQAESVRLSAIFERYRDDERANPLLFQPEALLIFERLEHDRDRLKAAWPADKLPLELLESMAAIWGVDI